MLILLAIGAVSFVLGRLILGHEPRCQGRSLGSWLAELDAQGMDTNTPAYEALRTIGSNAVPYLVRQLAREDPLWRRPVASVLSRRGITNLNASPSFQARLRAGRALELLGPDAAPALPLLIREIQRAGERGSSAGVGLAFMAENVPETIPRMIQELDLPYYRETLLHIIGAKTNHAETCVPYLVRCLEDPSPQTRVVALWTLGRYGPNAQTAEPAVRNLLNETNASVATEAVRTLKAIQPPK